MTHATETTVERRPINSRNTWWAESIAHFLVRRNITPNAISLCGMAASVVAGLVFARTAGTSGLESRLLWLGGGLLCQLRLLCNLFDGMVAVERNIASRKGELYNEVPDRVSDAAIFIGLGFAAGGAVELGYLAALVAVFVAYVRAASKSVGAPNDFCGPMAKPQRMALVTLLAAFMALAPDAWRLPWGETKVVLLVVVLGGVMTAVRRLWRAAKYLERLAP